MKFSTSSILLAASSLLGAAVAHNIQLAAHGRECFHEMLHKDDKMTVTFQVGDREFGSAGNLHVDFWVWIGLILDVWAGFDNKIDPEPLRRLWGTREIGFERWPLFHSPAWWQVRILLQQWALVSIEQRCFIQRPRHSLCPRSWGPVRPIGGRRYGQKFGILNWC